MEITNDESKVDKELEKNFTNFLQSRKREVCLACGKKDCRCNDDLL